MGSENDRFIVGLGNPGKIYHKNRHNIGFLLLHEFAKKHKSNINLKNKLKCYYSEFLINQIRYRLFMPNTFMNNSGEAIKLIIDWYKIDIEKIIIIVDDIDLPLGKIRFRNKGSSGGHNGLKSIINTLNSKDFKRIKVGIGSPPELGSEKKLNTVAHVLGNFSNSEEIILNAVYKEIIKSLEILNSDNLDSIINKLNSFKGYLDR